ncbi:type I-F CRISPR-associated helicase Cas3f [Psychrobacter sp. I-STPA10]|uniref:type I-F CRISPR-associated helicase Cas3f n=1 Tax=Psychrobacter sp. I-STPA10 TaxID=2585769 RepID=UPI001E634D25|nr:type I-F CRISPR-associated helicase Cas3f [Psychrobacter sp. I-STPA10]
MIVTFISQCEKKSLKRTRRILDAFANRIGSNVWQTAITEEGLNTVKQLLCKSATKSTAVSCHRVKTRRQSELLWVVGNKRKFNEVGIVPVNSTKRNLLHREWENDWNSLTSIQIIATIAALLHDIGKSTIGFQYKLFHPTFIGDPYRHEWISLKLFIWLIGDCQTDDEWLERLQHLADYLQAKKLQGENLAFELKELQKTPDKVAINELPPLAQWVAWLIVTHHRLPPLTAYYFNTQTAIKLKKVDNLKLKVELNKYYAHLKAYEYWVKNPTSITEMSSVEQDNFWQFDDLVIHSPLWQRKLTRWAKKARQHPQLIEISEQATKNNQAISNPFLLHLSRLCLMVGDHNYSSLAIDDKRRVVGSTDFKNKLAANTDRESGKIKQPLDEHLIGVGDFTAQFCRSLPAIQQALPRLCNHNPLVKNTAGTLFKWQNKAFKSAFEYHELSETHGFFGVNMASTGAGKTIGNARIMYALANPKKGARITVALGLRVLTLQTGLSFRRDLSLDANQLAILVGGTAQKQLFELNQQTGELDAPSKDKTDFTHHLESPENYSKVYGSESANDIIEEWVDSEIDIHDYDELGLGTVIASQKAQDLLFAPFVVCTVDHLMQASECKKGGKHIAPILRLLSSDLILDEPDDLDHNDLPALSRLIHLAGLFGSRVMLSSATLPPDMLQGLFEAYLTGRKLFNQQFNQPTPKVICGWFDENNCNISACDIPSNFAEQNRDFVQSRVNFLNKQPIRRTANILPLTMNYSKETHIGFYEQLGFALLQKSQQLHQHHHVKHPNSCHHVSIGLMRMANIQPLMNVAIAMLNLANTPESATTQYHLCCYHANQVLILRSRLEKNLDDILTRKPLKKDASNDKHNKDTGIFNHDAINTAINNHPHKKHHIFIVLATPVAEVGRDHDYDWAIVEPSSMRSLIQLAGRVWRHRPDKTIVNDIPNISILQYNIRALKHNNRGAKQAVFTMPGFEQNGFLLSSHNSAEIIRESELNRIDALPRISKVSAENFDGTHYLSDLEHSVMMDLMNNKNTNVVNGYWQNPQTSNRSHVHLSCLTPFRKSSPQTEYVIQPEDFKHTLYNGNQYRDNPDSDDEIDNAIDAAMDINTADTDSTLNKNRTNDKYPQQYLMFSAQQLKNIGIAKANLVNSTIKPTQVPISNPHVSPWLTDNLTQALIDTQAQFPELSPTTILIRFAVLTLYENQNGWLFDERFGCWRDEGMFKEGYG